MSKLIPETRSKVYGAFLADVAKAMGWRLPALIGLMTAVSFTEGLTIALLLPLLNNVGVAGTSDGVAATTINWLIDVIIPNAGVMGLLTIIVAFAIVQLALFLGQSWWIASLVCRHAASWQVSLFRSFLAAEWLYLTERRAGDLTNSIIVEAWRGASAFQYFTYLCSAALAALIYLAFALAVSWQTTLMMAGLAAAMAASISGLYRVSARVGRQTSALNAELQVLVGESLSNVKIIKSTVSEARVGGRMAETAGSLERLGRTAMFVPNLVRGLFEFMALSSMAAFLVYGTSTVHIAPADMFIVLALFVRLFPRFINVQTLLHQFNTYVPAVVILRQIASDTAARMESRGGARETMRSGSPTRLEVRNLGAGYGGAQVLRGIDLSITMPGLTGVVGASGAGKSTLIHVLLRLVSPEAGSIRLGSYEFNEVAIPAWRRAIGYVPQETMLFHASVAENIRMGAPEATDAEVIEAASLASAHSFISRLPRGYDTQIGDQGTLLSGGQRQRLGIARALLRKPHLLLLDEPTSALDTESELEVMAALDDLRRHVGIVIVAHRLTTVQRADQIYVLEQGSIIESGNWGELINRRGRLYALAKLQKIVS